MTEPLVSAPFMIGEIKCWALASAPTGWALCNGDVHLIANFPEAGLAFGNTFGGDGITTFGVPDLRDRVPVGVSDTVTLGSTGGANSVTLVTANLPAHSHALGAGITAETTIELASNVASLPSDTTPTEINHFIGGPTGGPGSAIIWKPSLGTAPVTQGGVTTAVTGSTEDTGGGESVDVKNPYLGLNWIICLTGV